MKKDVITATKETTIEETIKIFHERRIGSVVITDDKRKCVGIYTGRDLIRCVAEKIPENTPMRRAMTRNPITVSEEATIADAKALMISHKIRHLPVTDKDGQLVGILTIRDLLEELIGIPSMRR